MNFSRKLLFFVVAGVVLYFIVSRLHIVVLVHVSLWQGLLFTAIVILVLFLGLDHLLFRDRGSKADEK
jgi:hypothetical protein